MAETAVNIVRIKSTHPPSQGDFVEINETDYDPKVHELYDPQPAPQEPASDKKKRG